MSQLKIFSGIANGGQLNDSIAYDDAIALYLVNPDSIDEIAIEIFVQYAINTFDNRLVRIFSGYIQDTEHLIRLPEGLRNAKETQYLVLVPATDVNIEVWAIYDDQPTNEAIKQVVDNIKGQLTRIEIEQVAIGGNQIAQNAAITAIATTVGAGLALPTAGASLALPGVVTGVLAPSTTALTPLLVPGV